MLPIEATAVLGSLAGITEIAKGAFGGDGRAPPAVPPPTRPAAPTGPVYTAAMPPPRST
jgi:hypothetical protein